MNNYHKCSNERPSLINALPHKKKRGGGGGGGVIGYIRDKLKTSD